MYAGVDLLLAYPSKLYTTPVSVQHCEAFISKCKARIAAGSKVTDCQEAIWTLLKHMQSPVLPQATFSTFALATEAVIFGLNQETVPPYHALVQLQEHVWQRMHSVLDPKMIKPSVYLPAISKLDPSEAAQTALLMAQSGMKGLDFACCEALYLQLLDDEQTCWMKDVFGTDFWGQVEAVAEQGADSPHAFVAFPDHDLPQLSIFQLGDGASLYTLGHQTPSWMPPPVAWEDPAFVSATSRQTVDIRGSEPAPQKSDAEQLLGQYGRADHKHRRKGRK